MQRHVKVGWYPDDLKTSVIFMCCAFSTRSSTQAVSSRKAKDRASGPLYCEVSLRYLQR